MATVTIASTSNTFETPDQHENTDVEDIQSIITPVYTNEETPPSHAVSIAPRWNESKTMIWRLTATCWCALVMGANDAAYGAIISSVSLPYRTAFIPY